jgi:cytosine/uracil/thiamine/allantoin permease
MTVRIKAKDLINWGIDKDVRKYHYWRGFRVGAVLVFLVGVVPLVVILHKIYKLVLTLE